MVARLGRVIYWFCCAVAVLLAVIPPIVHGWPLLEKAPPPITAAASATIIPTETSAKDGNYFAKLPNGDLYELKLVTPPNRFEKFREPPADGTTTADPWKDFALAYNAEKIAPLPQGFELVTPLNPAPVEKRTNDVLRNALQNSLDLQHGQRASQWNRLVEISLMTLVGALLIFLFGRAARYILANE